MINTKIDASGLNLRFTLMSDKLKNAKTLMEKIGDYMVGSIRQNIEEGGRPNKYAQNIWGTTPLLKTGRSYFSVQKNEVSDSHVVVSSGGGGAAFSHNAHEVRNTLQAKRYFWWKYSQTKEPQWLSLALSKKATFQHPQRKYMMFQQPKDIDTIVQMIREHVLGN